MQMPEYDTKADTSDWSESHTARSEDGPPEMRTESAKRAMKSAKQKLCRSTRQKNPIVRYGYGFTRV